MVDGQQLEMVMALTQTISTLGGKFESMGQTFEQKLASIEAKHRELESRLAEVRQMDEKIADQENNQ